MGVAETNLEKAKAKEKITDSIRDLENLKITLPLGNPNLKLVHTNQMLFTELPTEVFELANMNVISKSLNSEYSRYSGYQLNRWYVEAVTITNEGNSAKMDLELNPFASSFKKYKDDKQSIEKAYLDAQNNSSDNASSSSVKSVSTTNKTLKGGQGKFIDDLVKKIVGKETDPLKKAKLIDAYFKKNMYYETYFNPKYTCKSLENGWNKKKGNCADGANLLCAMFLSAGLTATILHISAALTRGYGHYIVRLKINGKYYYTDHAAARGKKSTRKFNKVWLNQKKGSRVGTKISC